MGGSMRQALLAGLCFGGWPLIADLIVIYARVPGPWVGAVVMMVSALGLFFMGRAEMMAEVPTWTVVLLLLPGLINLAGMVWYGEVLSKKFGPLVTLLPVTYLTMIAVGVIGGAVLGYFSGDFVPTFSKVWNILGGTAASAVAIYFFSR